PPLQGLRAGTRKRKYENISEEKVSTSMEDAISGPNAGAPLAIANAARQSGVDEGRAIGWSLVDPSPGRLTWLAIDAGSLSKQKRLVATSSVTMDRDNMASSACRVSSEQRSSPIGSAEIPERTSSGRNSSYLKNSESILEGVEGLKFDNNERDKSQY
ncbi:hypothetical protein MKW92_021277, partial [Papaver armeniacum]